MESAYIARLPRFWRAQEKTTWSKTLFVFDTDRLVDCLRDFGPTDWQLAGLICKTLWNYSENITSAASYFGGDTDTLLVLLTSLLGEIRNLVLFSLIRGTEGAKSEQYLVGSLSCSFKWLASIDYLATQWSVAIQHIPSDLTGCQGGTGRCHSPL